MQDYAAAELHHRTTCLAERRLALHLAGCGEGEGWRSEGFGGEQAQALRLVVLGAASVINVEFDAFWTMDDLKDALQEALHSRSPCARDFALPLIRLRL